jgi:hypothetical protein
LLKYVQYVTNDTVKKRKQMSYGVEEKRTDDQVVAPICETFAYYLCNKGESSVLSHQI